MLQEYCSNTAVFLQYSCSNSNTGGILRYAAGMLQECYRNTARILQEYCRHTAGIRCGNAVGMLLECCKNIATCY